MIVDEELRLRDEPDAVPRARRFAATVAEAAGFADLVPDVQLVVSELVANAQLHAAPPVTVRIRATGDTLRVEVGDGSRQSPVRARPNVEAMTGRGIVLVERLSARWGVTQAEVGKTVWAELATDADAVPFAPPDLDADALLEAWGERDEPQRFTVRLGDVPTDLLLAAKSHVDNIVREFHLASGGAASGRAADVAQPLAQLIDAVVYRFAEARQSIKRQALAAAARGEVRTHLTLEMPASAAEAGEAYLRALDEADVYARAARLLTLETPPQHRVFRRWYVESLVTQVRAASAGLPADPPQTFEQRLLEELDVIASAHRVNDHAARLQTVTASLAATSTVDDIAAVVVTEGIAALGASACAVLVPSADGHFEILASVGYSEGVLDEIRAEEPDAELPAAETLRTGEAVWVESRQDRNTRYPGLVDLEPRTVSMCAVPLVASTRTLGALRFSFDSPRLFDDAERRFVLALAAQTAQALDRARALEEATKATGKLAFLAEASAELASTLDYRTTLGNIARLVVPRLADWCAVELREPDGSISTVAIAHVDPVKMRYVQELREKYPPDPDAPFGVPAVVRTGVSELYPVIPADRIAAGEDMDERQRIHAELGFRSAVIVPLIGRTGTLGVLTMVQADSGRRLDEGDLAVAEDVGRRAAVAVENAREYGEQSGRLETMTRVAETVQHAILAPVPERVGPLRLAARYVSAAEEALVGGDLYEVVQRPGAVRLLVGDVRGKGLDAVRLATVVLGGFRGAAIECDDLAALAARMDRRLAPYLTDDEDFVTAILAEIRDDGTCQLVTCGHPPALLARDGTVTPVDTPVATPFGLGIAEPTATTLQLRPGDRLLLHTDGLIETRTDGGEFVDAGPLVVPLASGHCLSRTLDDILGKLRAAAGGGKLGDDLALLAAEYAPE